MTPRGRSTKPGRVAAAKAGRLRKAARSSRRRVWVVIRECGDCRPAIGVGYPRCRASAPLLVADRSALRSPRPLPRSRRQDGTQTMDDGVSIAFTRYTPGRRSCRPAAGPASIVLHGLGRDTAARSSRSRRVRERRLLGARLRRPRPRRLRRRDHARRAARGRRPARAAQRARGAAPTSATRRSAPGGSRTAAARSGTRSPPASRSRRSRSSRPGRRSTTRSGRRTSRAPGSSPASPRSVAARSPLDRRHPRRRGPEHATSRRDPAADGGALGAREGVGSIRTPVYLFQGRVDFAFDLIAGDARRSRASAGPKKLYVGNFGHTPVDVPRARQRLRALAGRRLVRPLPEGERRTASTRSGS